jgi:hypothetical protein
VPNTSLAHRGRFFLPLLVLLIAFGALVAAACGDDDEPASTPTNTPSTNTPPAEGETPTPPPAGETITPTPEATTPDGFEAALRNFEGELIREGLDPITARLILREYTCTATDLTPALGQPECATAGEVIRAIEMSSWRSSGGLRKVESVVAFLQRLSGELRPETSDEWGDGAPKIFAFDSSVDRAVLTMRVDCQPQHNCDDGTQRVAMVLDFAYEEGRWKISRIMNAFVLYEEFLEPNAESGAYFPNWERLD